MGAWVQTALIVGGVGYPGLKPVSIEFFQRGFWAVFLPFRMRRSLYPGMHLRGSILFYYSSENVKLECFGGEDEAGLWDCVVVTQLTNDLLAAFHCNWTFSVT